LQKDKDNGFPPEFIPTQAGTGMTGLYLNAIPILSNIDGVLMARETKIAKRARAIAVAQRMHERYPDISKCLLNHSDPFTLVIAVLLSAQTTDKLVNKVTPQLFERWPDAQSLASAQLYEVEDVIHSLGFYHSKARNAVGAARMICAEFGGEVPRTMAELIRLPGVGRKTANIVLNTAFGIVVGIAVDTHVYRIAHKLGFSPRTHDSADKVERDLMDIYPQEYWQAINHQWVLFGREVCDAKKPSCAECPLVDLCPSASVIMRCP
jgi:endonuclease-3